MASLCKRCRHPRDQWDTCGCQWLIRQERNRRTVYTKVGTSRIRAEQALRRLTADTQETVSEAIDQWLAAKKLNPDARYGTINSYNGRSHVVRVTYGHIQVRHIQPGDLTDFAQGLLRSGYAPSTARGMYAVFVAVLKHAAVRGVIHQLPLPPTGSGIPMPRERRHDITVPDLLAVIGRMPRQWGLLAELCLLTGLRVGEALAIERGDVSDGFLHVRRTRNRRGAVNGPKTRRSERLIPLDDRAQFILEELHLPVAMSYTQARRVLDDALGPLKRRGLSWHVFRHAHVTLLEQDGASLREVADRLGHGHNYTVTLGYTLKSQARPPRQLGDLLMRHGAAPSAESDVASVDELAERRAARAARRPAAP